jgi:hypothetical protein
MAKVMNLLDFLASHFRGPQYRREELTTVFIVYHTLNLSICSAIIVSSLDMGAETVHGCENRKDPKQRGIWKKGVKN